MPHRGESSNSRHCHRSRLSRIPSLSGSGYERLGTATELALPWDCPTRPGIVNVAALFRGKAVARHPGAQQKGLALESSSYTTSRASALSESTRQVFCRNAQSAAIATMVCDFPVPGGPSTTMMRPSSCRMAWSTFCCSSLSGIGVSGAARRSTGIEKRAGHRARQPIPDPSRRSVIMS